MFFIKDINGMSLSLAKCQTKSIKSEKTDLILFVYLFPV